MKMKTVRGLSLFSLFTFLWVLALNGQNILDCQPIINEIGALESARDAKCHATASRLEDFIYGTPLSFSARNKRIEFQKSYVKTIWLDFTRTLNDRTDSPDELQLFRDTEAKFFTYSQKEEGIDLKFRTGHSLFISARDYRQYSSVAYALRAILSVQQSFLFESETLATLDKPTLEYFKKSVDLAVLALLNKADDLARTDNSPQIEEKHIAQATTGLFNNLQPKPVPLQIANISAVDQKTVLYNIIKQKLTAYQNYNEINQSVFLRNIQVYFTKVPWPTDGEESNNLKNYFTENMVQITSDLLAYAEGLSRGKNKSVIEYEEMYEAVQTYLPHSVNMFEDVIYFPKLGNEGKVVIEAYDLDAFRDSGLHWQYLKFALDDRKDGLKATPDPFALEMLVEGVAQFAVLVFRLAGNDAKVNNPTTLTIENLTNSLRLVQQKINQHYNIKEGTAEEVIVSENTDNNNISNSKNPFTEVSDAMNLNFEHRNSDWLNRKIRSYVVKEDENLARLSIPPAFGGGGVASEDIDNDGFADILLLGGRGNKLLKNDGGKKFIDITKKAGISPQRPDGNYGEPRQPIIADFDNDGLQDIFISYANDAHRIYKNLGNGKFEDMTQDAGLGGEGLVGGPATAIDYDKDGLLDIYIGYFGNYLKGELPTLKRHNTNGSPNKLFKNTGNFRFEDVSSGSGLENTGWTQAVGHSDINQDGWQDIIVGNDFGVNGYYLNNHDGTFTDISKEIGTDKPSYTMNVGVGDLNRDLYPDFYISNIVVMEKDDKYVLPNEDTRAHFDPSSLSTMRVVEANDLFLSSKGIDGNPTYVKSEAVGRGFSATGWSWDADFFDYDNDGDDDLYCLTGMNPYSVYGTDNEYYSSPEGESKEVVYAASSAEANIFFENKNGVLEVAENSGGLDFTGTSRSAAYLDMDNDGDLDIVVNEYQGKATLFRNNAEQNNRNWAKIKLIGDPTKGITKDAVGAVLILSPKGSDLKIWKEVHSTTGYLSGHPKNLHIGLNDSNEYDLEIRWPNGRVQTLKNLKANIEKAIVFEN